MPRRQPASLFRTAAWAFAIAILTAPAAVAQEPKAGRPPEPPKDAKALYAPNKVWTVHLTFTADQWAAIEPKRNPPNPGGAFGGGNNAPGVRAAQLLTPVVMSQGDANRDGRLTAEELTALGQKWFKAWDKDSTGKLTEAQLRSGLDTLRHPLGSGGLTLIGAEGKRNGIASVFGVEVPQVHAALDFEGQTFKDVAVRYKGNGTFLELGNNPKRSFKIDLNKYQEGQKLGGVTTLNLQNNITDASWMNETLAYRLYRDAEVPAPRSAYARVHVTVPGKFERKYFGLYSLTENVDTQFAETNFPTKQRGALFKPVTPLLFADLGADWAAYNQMYDPKGKPTDEQKKRLMDLCRLVSQSDDKEFATRVGDFVDLPEFARFLAVMVYLSDIDGLLGPGQNMYLYLHPETRKFVFIPWDQDRSWGQFARASQKQRDQLSIERPWQGDKPFLERIFKVEAFKKAYLQSMQEFSKTLFQPERIAKQVDELATAIRPAIQEEPVSSIDRFDLAAAGKMLPPVRGRFGGETQPIKPYTKVRTESVIDQLSGKSAGLTLGGGFGAPPPSKDGRSELSLAASGPLYRLLATDKETELTAEQVTRGFEQLFKTWDTEKKGQLGYAQLRTGMEKSFGK